MTHGAVGPIEWGDGDYVFDLCPIAMMLELEEKCDAGIYEIFKRLSSGNARLNDIRETIRLGLIGGGKTPVQALSLVKRYVDNRPLGESLPLAIRLTMSAIVGVPGDEVGKKPETEQTESKAEPASSAPSSTVSEPLSASDQEKLIELLSGNYARASMGGTESMDHPTSENPK